MCWNPWGLQCRELWFIEHQGKGVDVWFEQYFTGLTSKKCLIHRNDICVNSLDQRWNNIHFRLNLSIHSVRSWPAVSPVTIAAAGKRLAPVIIHRATGDVEGVGIRQLPNRYWQYDSQCLISVQWYSLCAIARICFSLALSSRGNFKTIIYRGCWQPGIGSEFSYTHV